MELVPAPVAALVPVVSPISENSGIYLDWAGTARACGVGMRSWLVIGRPRLQDHVEHVGKPCYWHFIPSLLVAIS